MSIKIAQEDEIVNLFGYWPKFSDAKLLSFSIDTAAKNIQLLLFYIDSDKNISAKIELSFKFVTDINLKDLFDENVLDELSIVQSGSNYMIELIGCYGLNGRFLCEFIEAKLISP